MGANNIFFRFNTDNKEQKTYDVKPSIRALVCTGALAFCSSFAACILYSIQFVLFCLVHVVVHTKLSICA